MADEKKLDPNAPLKGADLKAAQAKIKEAILAADEAIYKTVGDLPGKLTSVARGIENVLTLGTLTETRKRVETLYAEAVESWEKQKINWWDAVNNGVVYGTPITQTQAIGIVKAIQKQVAGVNSSIELVQQYAKGTVIWKAVGDVFLGIVEALRKVGKLLGDLVNAIAAIGSGAADTAAKTAGFLPLIIGVLILGPLLLRSFSAYKKGGAAAAADEAASQIESGRRAVGEGARKAWEGGKSLAKRYASGGTMSGSPRRRRRSG